MVWDLLSHAPPYVVLVFLVLKFLNHIEESNRRQDAVVKSIAEDQKEMAETVVGRLNENTAAIVEFNLRTARRPETEG